MYFINLSDPIVSNFVREQYNEVSKFGGSRVMLKVKTWALLDGNLLRSFRNMEGVVLSSLETRTIILQTRDEVVPIINPQRPLLRVKLSKPVCHRQNIGGALPLHGKGCLRLRE